MTVCGNVIASVFARHFCATELIDHPGIPHTHASAWLLFGLAGRVRDFDGADWLSCDSETAIARPGSTEHVSEFTGEARAIVVQSLSAQAARTIEGLATRQRVFRNGELRESFLRVWLALHDGDRAAAAALDGAVFTLLADLLGMSGPGRASSKSHLATRLEAFFEERPEGAAIAELAARNRMSTRTYVRHFRLETGLSVAQYLSHLRIERAKTLLRTTSLSMLEIARHLGYCDRSHFARGFSRAVGMTPLQYRTSIV